MSSVLNDTIEARVEEVFGASGDAMSELDGRAARVLEGEQAIVWECDARTFVFSHVSASAEEVLGYPRARWTEEPTFWADVVLHPGDRDQSVTYCVAETGACRDHAFVYRARAADGRVVRLRDFVKVITDDAGAPSRLRGVMVALPEA
jgi:PAS domain-containing protein